VLVPVWKGTISKLCLFALHTCHQTEKWEVQAESEKNISTVHYFLGFYSGANINADQFRNNRG
jgi:hypothetical protein